MRVLVTGASGLIGRTTSRLLAGAGHDVVAMSRTRPIELPRGVRFVSADVRDVAGLDGLVAGCDAVVHTAFMLDARGGADTMRATNVDGTAGLVAAAERAEVRRFVYTSSSTVYGPRSTTAQRPSTEQDAPTPHPLQDYALHKVETEELIRASSVDSVIVRANIVLGRLTDNRLQEAVAAAKHVVPAGEAFPWQVVHHDDVARFLVRACTEGPTGTVNLAAEGLVDLVELAELLERGVRRVPMPVLRTAVKVLGPRMGLTMGELEAGMHMPVLDTSLLRGEWGFSCAWHADEVAEDTRLAVLGRTTKRGRVVEERSRTPFFQQVLPNDAPAADGQPLHASSAEGQNGEFDSPVDARFPVYSMTNLAEALPGPSTPLTIDVQSRGLRATTVEVVRMLGITGPFALEGAARAHGIHGHTFYMAGTSALQFALSMPGTDEDAMADQYVGRHADLLPGGRAALRGSYVPPARGKATEVAQVSGALRSVLARGRGAKHDVREVQRQAARVEALLPELETMPDERLEAVLLLAGDVLSYAWTVQGVLNLVGGAAVATAMKKGGDAASLTSAENLASGNTLRGVRLLAERAAADPELLGVLSSGADDLERQVREKAPDFWVEVQRALDLFGHRGPGEAELDSRSFSDDVGGFLVTVGKAATGLREESHPAAEAGGGSRLERLAARMLGLREDNRDRCVRLTWMMRRLALERGRRLVAAGVLAAPDDAYYLTLAELVGGSPEAAATVTRRRAERERLRRLQMPPVFANTWHADVLDEGGLAAGSQIDGIGICAGVVRGVVRIVSPDDLDSLEPDEVLVAKVTDVGYTALFGHCAAVVTDIGGVMSHAAIVAREYGVPCVVDTQIASTSLRTGDLVEVDGKAGRVTLIERAA